MRITILCSSSSHPVNRMLLEWIKENSEAHDISLARSKKELGTGDILFLISCSEIITAKERESFAKTLVIHASDLPQGRGWSPHIWAVIEGKTDIAVSLLEAEDKVDSGAIWRKTTRHIPLDALHDEINDIVFDAERELMDFAVSNFDTVVPRPQSSDLEPTYYARRTPVDSQVDPNGSIADQFDMIRTCDPDRFPAFFELRGAKFKLIVERLDD